MTNLYKKLFSTRHYIIGVLSCIFIITLICKVFLCIPYHNKNYLYKAYFTTAEGLHSKIPIMLFGYKIGYIKKVYLDRENYPVAILSIDKNIAIPDDSTISIKEHSIMGDKVLQLNLGVSEEVLPNKSTIMYTNSGISLLQLMDILIDYIDNIRKANK